MAPIVLYIASKTITFLDFFRVVYLILQEMNGVDFLYSVLGHFDYLLFF